MALFEIVTVEKCYKVGEVVAMGENGIDFTIGKRDYHNVSLSLFVQLCMQQNIVVIDKHDSWVCKTPTIQGTNFFERQEEYHNRMLQFVKELVEVGK